MHARVLVLFLLGPGRHPLTEYCHTAVAMVTSWVLCTWVLTGIFMCNHTRMSEQQSNKIHPPTPESALNVSYKARTAHTAPSSPGRSVYGAYTCNRRYSFTYTELSWHCAAYHYSEIICKHCLLARFISSARSSTNHSRWYTGKSLCLQTFRNQPMPHFFLTLTSKQCFLSVFPCHTHTQINIGQVGSAQSE